MGSWQRGGVMRILSARRQHHPYPSADVALGHFQTEEDVEWAASRHVVDVLGASL